MSLPLSSGKWIACQSMDNQIKVYGVHNNFRLNRKKTFRGHIVRALLVFSIVCVLRVCVFLIW